MGKDSAPEKLERKRRTIPRWIQVVAFALMVLLLIVGIPLIINGCYKKGGYITMWDAADVLAYYGTLLGSAVAVGVLALTIIFTRKQIERERFLERNREKWGKVEEVITKALIDISPLKMRTMVEMDSQVAMLYAQITSLQSYALTAMTSLDMVKCYCNANDKKWIGTLIEEIDWATIEFCKIERELETEYTALQKTAMTQGRIPQSEMQAHIAREREIASQIAPVHASTYQKLLELKRETFTKIYTEIDEQANELLKLSRKRTKKASS